MVEVQIAPIENRAAILAGVPIPLEEVVTGELDLFFRETVEAQQQNDPGYPNPEGDRAHGAIGLGIRVGQVAPLLEVQCPVITVPISKHHLCVPFEEKRQRPTD